MWNRLNVGIFGYFRDAGTGTGPSLTEWALSLGVIAAAGLVFLYVVREPADLRGRLGERGERQASLLAGL